MRGKRQRTEQSDKSAVANVEPAGIGAECRHHHPLGVGGEAAPRYAAAALRDPRAWMQMADNLSIGAVRRRFMAKSKRPDCKFRGDAAADALRRIGIVVAGEPEPIAAALKTASDARETSGMRAGPPPS